MSLLSKAYQDALNKIQDQVKKAIEYDGQDVCYVQFLAYDSDMYDMPINNLNEVPLKGKVKFVDGGDLFCWWYKEKGKENLYKPFESEVMKNPTWLDICILANKMIVQTCNLHHVYLDGLTDIHIEDGVYIATFSMKN